MKIKYNITKEFLVKEYLDNKKSIRQITDFTGCSRHTIQKYIRKFDIVLRNLSESTKLNTPKGEVNWMSRNAPYGEKALAYKDGRTLIDYYCKCGKLLSGQTRTGMCASCSHKGYVVTEETKKKLSNAHLGSNHWNWHGGISKLQNVIRNLFLYKDWRIAVFKKDNYICQDCFKRGGNLEAHHLRPFSIILNEFLRQYNQFSPVEDKEILVRLAIKYEPFWNVSNGQTLCDKCHDLYTARHDKEIENEITRS